MILCPKCKEKASLVDKENKIYKCKSCRFRGRNYDIFILVYFLDVKKFERNTLHSNFLTIESFEINSSIIIKEIKKLVDDFFFFNKKLNVDKLQYRDIPMFKKFSLGYNLFEELPAFVEIK